MRSYTPDDEDDERAIQDLRAQTDLAEVVTFLRTAAERNADRFAGIVAFDEDRE